jgi:hypothetical protein
MYPRFANTNHLLRTVSSFLNAFAVVPIYVKINDSSPVSRKQNALEDLPTSTSPFTSS